MKSILNLVCLSLVLSFAAACGKKESGSSSSNSSNPLYNGSVIGSAAHNELVNWLNTPDSSGGMRAYFLKKSGSMSGWVDLPLCATDSIFNIGFLCNKPTSCLESLNAPSGVVADIGVTKFTGSENLRPNGCTLSGTYYNKSADTVLREAVQGKSGRNVLIDRTTKSGSIFTVYYSLYSGTTTLSGAAQFNTSLPAALNPVVIEENGQRTKTYFTPY